MVFLFHLGQKSVDEVTCRRDVLGLFQEPLQPSFFIADFIVDLMLHILQMALTCLINLIIFVIITY